MTDYEGGCRCGAVRYVARGLPINERVCHCRICQTVVGAAFNARLLFAAADVTVTGAVQSYASSPAIARGFCGRCGATLFATRAAVQTIGITAGSLDDPGRFQPSMHIWTAFRQPWIALADGLPQHPGAAPV